jgi:hypothetical protein
VAKLKSSVTVPATEGVSADFVVAAAAIATAAECYFLAESPDAPESFVEPLIALVVLEQATLPILVGCYSGQWPHSKSFTSYWFLVSGIQLWQCRSNRGIKMVN